MLCETCSNLKLTESKHDIETKKCFFHITKDIMMNNDLDFVKNWIDELYKKYRYSSRVYIFNPSSKELLSFYGLLVKLFPRLLRQPEIYRKGNTFLSNVSNYMLKLAKESHIKIEKETLTTYLKNVKINMKNIDKNVLKETHLYYCVMKQELPLSTALKYCYPVKKGKELSKIITFYIERDRLIWRYLYLPTPIIQIIVDKL